MENQSNKVVPLRTLEVIREEAASWLVKLDGRLDSGSLSPGDLSNFKDWLSQDPRHGKMLKRQLAVWSDMDVFAKVALDTKAHHIGIRWGKILKARMVSIPLATACSFLFFWGAWLLVFPDLESDSQLYATNIGVQRVEELSDGSVAHLNTDSLIEINYSENERAVELLRGEAMFDVFHDPDRPFVVYAAGNAVQAVGTRFLVRLTSNKIRVTVAEGQVRLSSQSDYGIGAGGMASADPAVQEVILLSQGQVAERDVQDVEDTLLSDIEEEEIQRRFSWTDGRLIFEDESLETIISEVSRYTSVRVVISDSELREIRLSGRFQIGDTEALLEAIEISGQGIQVNRNAEGDMIYISKNSG